MSEARAVSSRPLANPIHALEIVVAEIRKALEDDNTELAMAYLPVVEWAIEVLGEQDGERAL